MSPLRADFFIAIMTCDSNIVAQVLYQDQNIMELIGDVNSQIGNVEAKSAFT